MKRWSYASIDVTATALAILGVLLPGLPATAFALIAFRYSGIVYAGAHKV